MKLKTMLAALLLAATLTPQAAAQDIDGYGYVKVDKQYRFRVSLTDKKNNPYSLKKPEAFLSKKSLDRRKRYGLKLDAHDLPVTPSYVEALRGLGLRIHNMSKWQNTVVVETAGADTTVMEQVRRLPFVSRTDLVWIGPDSMFVRPEQDRTRKVQNRRDTLDSYYGRGDKQVRMLGCDRLHEAGFRGQGMTIAILDGGFYNADVITGFDRTRILGVKSFVEPNMDVYGENSHGMMVLSCIGANVPHSLVGTAPEAEFYLIQTEDGRSEQLVEMDNYCAGLEYADSLGCDVVTASLGYISFDHKWMNLPYSALDGQTAINSRSASLAASRGMLLLNSAGNEGDGTWKKIGFPADARDMLAVGAVSADSTNTDFSSLGYSADGRVKPDAMAVGGGSAVYNTRGNLSWANGTSFSCPILCGAVTCLWQAHRDKKPLDIIKAVHQAGNYADRPNEVFGYGIPNLWKAHESLK